MAEERPIRATGAVVRYPQESDEQPDSHIRELEHRRRSSAARHSGELHGLVGPYVSGDLDLVDIQDDTTMHARDPYEATADMQRQHQQRDVELQATISTPRMNGAAANGAAAGNGVAVNGAVKAVAEEEVEAGEAGPGAEHTAGLGELASEKQLTLSFNGLSAWVPTALVQPSIFKRLAKKLMRPAESTKPGRRQILHNLSGQVRPGQVLALMGPSGSGKTSLLSVIGGRAPKRVELEGSVTVNGAVISKSVRRRIGFVLQDDVLYEALTVRETLLYAAYLRLPRILSRAEKGQRVDHIIDALGLRKSAGTIIGGFMRRGISGGERKRVSIGHELLIDPAVLLLDEPTSGLDSTTAMHLLTLLQDLASGGRAVCTTIHQPSSRLYQKLDRLMLLAEGHCMYYGPAHSVLDWFGGFCYKIPFGVSIPDYILDLAMGEAGYSCSGKRGQDAVKELYSSFEQYLRVKPDGFDPADASKQGLACKLAPVGEGQPNSSSSFASPFAQSNDLFGLPISSEAYADKHGHKGGLKDQAVAGTAAAAAGGRRLAQPAASEQRQGASWFEQVRTLTTRAIKVRRFEQLTFDHFFQLVAVALISGLLWWQRGASYTVSAGTDIMGALFFLLLFSSFRSLFHALFTFPSEQRMIMKERPSGLYRLSAYYISRVAADVPIELLNTVLFATIVYWFAGLKRTAAAYFAALFTMILVTLVAEAWGLLIGGIAMNPKKAQSITTVIMLTFLLVGGYYVRNIPVWIAWIKYLSFLYWGYNLLVKIQYSDAQYYNCPAGAPRSLSQAEAANYPGCTPVANIQTALGLPTYPEDNAYPEALVLLGFLFVLRTAVYFVLQAKTRTRSTVMK